MSTITHDIEQLEDQLLGFQETVEEKSKESGQALREYLIKRKEMRQAEVELTQGLAALASGQSFAQPKASTNGRRKKTPKDELPSKGKRAKSGSGKKKGCRVVVFEILKRPQNAKGLTVAQITDAIESEKLWETDKDIGKQVQSNVQLLKTQGKVVRDAENSTYYIPEGVDSL